MYFYSVAKTEFNQFRGTKYTQVWEKVIAGNTFRTAIDSKNNIIIASPNVSKISKLSPQGIVLWTYTTTAYCYGLAIDSDDNIYVTSTGKLTKLTSEGILVWQTSMVNSQYDLAIDGDRNSYITTNPDVNAHVKKI
jgi:hypothetical protein